MANDFLTQFIGNQNRARLLRVFAFNQGHSYTLIEAAKRSGISPRVAETEMEFLRKLELIKPGKLTISIEDRQKGPHKAQRAWTFNSLSKHAAAVSKFVYEVSPKQYDEVVAALRRSGTPTAVILSGCFVGDPSRPADLIVALDTHNEARLEQAVRDLEPVYGREIRYAVFSTPEFRFRLTISDRLIRDTLDYPHLVLLDKTRML